MTVHNKKTDLKVVLSNSLRAKTEGKVVASGHTIQSTFGLIRLREGLSTKPSKAFRPTKAVPFDKRYNMGRKRASLDGPQNQPVFIVRKAKPKYGVGK